MALPNVATLLKENANTETDAGADAALKQTFRFDEWGLPRTIGPAKPDDPSDYCL